MRPRFALRLCAIALALSDAAPSLSQSGDGCGWLRQAGWDAMCARNDQPHDFCTPASGPESVEDTAELRTLLAQLNTELNLAYQYLSDSQIYGVEDHWTVPAGNAADCEDFVLLKMLHLSAAGIPLSSMSILAGNLRWGHWHAVLVVNTSSGPLVLDNLKDAITPLDRSRFASAYLMSLRDPSRWWPL